jgi:hypothetical protein
MPLTTFCSSRTVVDCGYPCRLRVVAQPQNAELAQMLGTLRAHAFGKSVTRITSQIQVVFGNPSAHEPYIQLEEEVRRSAAQPDAAL